MKRAPILRVFALLVLTLPVVAGTAGGDVTAELLSGDAPRVHEALDRIIRSGFGSERAVAPLVRLLEDAAFRAEAIEALGSMGPAAETAAPALKKWSLREDHRVWVHPKERKAASESLARVACTSAGERWELFQRASGQQEPSASLAKAGTRLLREEALPEAVRGLREGPAALRNVILDWMSETGTAPAETLTAVVALLSEQDPGSRAKASEVLAMMGRSAVPALEALAARGSGLLARSSIRTLAKMEGEHSRDPAALTAACLGPDLDTVAAAVEALTTMEEAGGRCLIALAKSPRAAVRGLAVRALGGFGALGLQTLVEALVDADPDVRREAVLALGRVGPEARSCLQALLRAAGPPGSPTVSSTWPVADPASLAALRWATAAIGLDSRDAEGALRVATYDPDRRVRAFATASLSTHPSTPSMNERELLRRLTSPDVAAGREALTEIASQPQPSAPLLSAVAAVVRAPSSPLRSQALAILVASAPASPGLTTALEVELCGPDPSRSSLKADSFGTSCVCLAPVLVKVLGQYRCAGQDLAEQALSRMGRGAVPLLADCLARRSEPGRYHPSYVYRRPDRSSAEAARRAVRALLRMGAAARDAAPWLVSVLANRPEYADEECAAAASQALGAIGEPAMGLVVACLVSTSPQVRLRSLGALQQILARPLLSKRCLESAGVALGGLLSDQEIEIRRLALFLLGETDVVLRGLAPALVQALRESDPDLRALAARALTRSGDDGVRRLLPCIDDGDPRFQAEVLLTLAMLGRVALRHVPALPSILTHQLMAAEPPLREAAACGLARLAAAVPEAAARVRELLQTAAPAARQTILAELCASGRAPLELAGVLARLSASDDEVSREHCRTLLLPMGQVAAGAVAAQLQSTSAEVRLQSLRLLLRFGPSAAREVGAVAGCLEDTDPGVRLEAAGGLAALGRAAIVVLPGLGRRARLGPPRLRRAAIRTLAALGGGASETVPLLMEFASDREPEVAVEASLALARVVPIETEAAAAAARLFAHTGRWEAASALLARGGTRNQPLMRALLRRTPDDLAPIARALEALGTEATGVLVECSRDPRPARRLAACALLATCLATARHPVKERAR